MKQFKLVTWPDLPAQYQRTAYRRMLSDMSQRYMSLSQLTTSSGLARQDVRTFLDKLQSLELLCEREVDISASLVENVVAPFGARIRRFLTAIGWS